MTNEKIISLIKQQCPGVKLIYLFGSRASKQQTSESDWDIAVLNDHKIDSMERWKINEILANECHSEVDFIDLLETSTVLRMQVVENGELLFDKDNYASYFEMQVLSMYSRLQEGRKGIIDSFITEVKEKGASYG